MNLKKLFQSSNKINYFLLSIFIMLPILALTHPLFYLKIYSININFILFFCYLFLLMYLLNFKILIFNNLYYLTLFIILLISLILQLYSLKFYLIIIVSALTAQVINQQKNEYYSIVNYFVTLTSLYLIIQYFIFFISFINNVFSYSEIGVLDETKWDLRVEAFFYSETYLCQLILFNFFIKEKIDLKNPLDQINILASILSNSSIVIVILLLLIIRNRDKYLVFYYMSLIFFNVLIVEKFFEENLLYEYAASVEIRLTNLWIYLSNNVHIYYISLLLPLIYLLYKNISNLKLIEIGLFIIIISFIHPMLGSFSSIFYISYLFYSSLESRKN